MTQACDAALPPRVEVAVGVVVRADGAALLAQRPQGKPYAGWWEFPGGKVEAGEGLLAGLARELHEELGLHVTHAVPWVTLTHDYPHARVRLNFCKVLAWDGEPTGREGQAYGWWLPGSADSPQPVLPATVPVLKWLLLPQRLDLTTWPAPQALYPMDDLSTALPDPAPELVVLTERAWLQAQQAGRIDLAVPAYVPQHLATLEQAQALGAQGVVNQA